MVPAVNGTIVVYVRAILSALTLILTVATIIPGYISMSEFQGKQMRTINYNSSLYSTSIYSGRFRNYLICKTARFSFIESFIQQRQCVFI